MPAPGSGFGDPPGDGGNRPDAGALSDTPKENDPDAPIGIPLNTGIAGVSRGISGVRRIPLPLA